MHIYKTTSVSLLMHDTIHVDNQSITDNEPLIDTDHPFILICQDTYVYYNIVLEIIANFMGHEYNIPLLQLTSSYYNPYL